MRVLITNFRLSVQTGSELATCELALGLQAAGVRTAVFTSRIGPLAERLLAAKIPVVDNLDKVPFQPQVIHGQHNLETLIALTHFPKCQAVYACHSREAWRELPPVHTRISRYVSASPRISAWFASNCGIPEEKCRVLAEPIKLSEIQHRPRTTSAKARIFQRTAAPIAALQKVCASEGLTLGTIDEQSESSQQLLAESDVVFASGRSAVEALAAGCSVILTGPDAVGEAITADSYEEAKARNFAPDPERSGLEANDLAIEFAKLRMDGSNQLHDWVRRDFDFDATIAAWTELYREVLAEDPPRANARREQKEMAQFLQRLAVRGHEEDRKIEAVHDSLRELSRVQTAPDEATTIDVVKETLAARLFEKTVARQPEPTPEPVAAPKNHAPGEFTDLALSTLGSCAMTIVKIAPAPLLIAVGRLTGHVAFWLDARRRETVVRNQALAFPKLNDRAIRWLTQKHFRRTGEKLAFGAKSLTIDAKTASKFIELTGAEHVLDPSGTLIENVVFAMGRFGNVELPVRALGAIPGARPAATFRALPLPRLNALLQKLRKRSGTLFFERGADSSKLARAMLQPSLALGVQADQLPARHGVEVSFFGRNSLASTSALDLARSYGCPLHVLTCARIKPGRWRFDISPEIPLEDDGEARADAAVLQEVHDIFEDAIRRDPANWFWLHERWDEANSTSPKLGQDPRS